VHPRERRVTVVGAIPDEAYATVGSSPDVTYPQVTWSFVTERSASGVGVAVTHEAGTPVQASRLSVRADRETVEGVSWPVSPAEGTLRPGDTFRVDLGSAVQETDVGLLWGPPAGSATAGLGRYSGD